MKWCLHEREVQVLTDTRATDNFIRHSLAAEVKLVLIAVPPYVVCLGDGRKTQGYHICRDVSLIIQKYKVTADFLPIHDLCIDIILRLEWLSTLGWTLTHWDLLLLKFQVDGVWQTLESNPEGSRLHTSTTSRGRQRSTSQDSSIMPPVVSPTAACLSPSANEQKLVEHLTNRFLTVFSIS